MAKMSRDHSASGSMHMRKTIEEALELIETVATNQHLYLAVETFMKGEVKAISTEPNPREQDGPLTQQLHALAQQLLELQEALRETQASNRNVEAQLSQTRQQLSKQITEECHAIQLRSGKSLNTQPQYNKRSKEEKLTEEHQTDVQDISEGRGSNKGIEHPSKGGQSPIDNTPHIASNPLSNAQGTQPPSTKIDEYKAKMPFPQKLHQVKKYKQFVRFADYLKTLEIKIPFAEALEQIPSYTKFMKDILSHKKDGREAETVFLTEECSAVIQNSLLEKLKNLGSFMIPCTLGNACTRTALCDLGGRINLIPASLIKKLCLTNEVKPTRICLQLADGSVKIPSGVVENMIVRVVPFTFPTDFVVLDMDGHKSASLILGRPFLTTRRTLIDV
ncbi:uncharacterized protein LOC107493684 [Arachis duranensis]|uniref:Uncharacterized protein LOC107493684 n=1 Tax=Arachis duranensis TaxID=130453 RepID=A0A6P4DPM5_ARADU|nr:uncharacterized protein LOC107493684 [Arachis duranensis]